MAQLNHLGRRGADLPRLHLARVGESGVALVVVLDRSRADRDLGAAIAVPVAEEGRVGGGEGRRQVPLHHPLAGSVEAEEEYRQPGVVSGHAAVGTAVTHHHHVVQAIAVEVADDPQVLDEPEVGPGVQREGRSSAEEDAAPVAPIRQAVVVHILEQARVRCGVEDCEDRGRACGGAGVDQHAVLVGQVHAEVGDAIAVDVADAHEVVDGAPGAQGVRGGERRARAAVDGELVVTPVEHRQVVEAVCVQVDDLDVGGPVGRRVGDGEGESPWTTGPHLCVLEPRDQEEVANAVAREVALVHVGARRLGAPELGVGRGCGQAGGGGQRHGQGDEEHGVLQGVSLES